VRFCQAIGCEGYVELQAVIREQLPRYLTYVEKVEKRLASAAPENEVLARVFATDASIIERTTDLVDPHTFEAAAAAICRASGILAVGAGLSAPPALFFAHSLRMMGFSVRVVTTDGMPLALELSAGGADFPDQCLRRRSLPRGTGPGAARLAASECFLTEKAACCCKNSGHAQRKPRGAWGGYFDQPLPGSQAIVA
jgi:hypothetical protein